MRAINGQFNICRGDPGDKGAQLRCSLLEMQRQELTKSVAYLHNKTSMWIRDTKAGITRCERNGTDAYSGSSLKVSWTHSSK